MRIIFGFIFDKVKFKNGQKSLPWLRIATALIPVVTIILFAIPSGLSETGKLVWFGVAYLLWDTVYTLTDVPAYAMLNTMTDNLQERNTLLSVNRVFSGGGVVIYGVVLPLLISEQVGMSASMAIAIMSIFSAITMVPLSMNCKERNYKPEEEDEEITIEVAVEMAKKLVEDGLSKNEAAKEIAKETGLKKSDIYKSLQNG